MGWLRNLGEQNPLSVSLGLMVVFIMYLAVPAAFSSSSFGGGETHADIASMTRQLRVEFGLAAAVLAAILLLGWLRATRLTTPVRWRGLVWLVPPLIYTLVLGIMVVTVVFDTEQEGLPEQAALWALLATVLLIGVFEELLFRGVVFHGIEAASGTLTALVVSSVLFGLTHYVNWVGGQPFDDTTYQVLHAAAGGFLYGAIMLMTGSIWPAILLHGLWDAMVSIVSTVQMAEAGATNVETDALAAVDVTSVEGGAGLADYLVSALLGGFEPLYGLVVLVVYLARKAPLPKAEGDAP